MRQQASLGLDRTQRALFSRSGEWFRVIRGTETARVQGVRSSEKEPSRHYIYLRPTEDVKADDVLVSEPSAERFVVTEVRTQVLKGKVRCLHAFYQTPFEIEQEKKAVASQGGTFNIGTAHGSIIGNQQTATIHNTFDFAALDGEIDKRGGADTAELKAMIAEIKDILAKSEQVPRGVFTRFSDVMERHAWLAEPVAHIVLLWTLGRFKVPLG